MNQDKINIFKQKIWQEHQINHLLIFTDVNRFWLTEFKSSYGYILISKNNQLTKVFLDARYLQEGKKTIKNCQVLPIENFGITWLKLKGRVGFENNLTYQHWQNLKKINSSIKWQAIDFKKLRLIKTAKEITKIRKVCQITAQFWTSILPTIKKLKREKMIEQLIRQKSLQWEITEQAFFPIVASGTNSALIHTQAKKSLIKDNILCDFGFKINGYCSDFTRTIILKPNSKLKFYQEIVQKIQQKVIAKIKPGVKIADLAKTAQKMYQKHNLKLEHSLGHGIGLEVHEYPNIIDSNSETLKPGMVFTIEPGVYLPQIGGVRIEDVVLVTKSGYEILTKT